jgi:uncharacterized protein YkwD
MYRFTLILKKIGIVLCLLIPNYLISQDTSKIEKEIFKQINNYRIKIGEPKFIYISSKVQSCRNHSKFMGTKNSLEHVKNLSKVGANSEIIQLNFTYGRTLNEIGIDVLDIFLDSPPHKKIIEGDYKEISIGVYITEDKDLWVTIRFI